MLGQPEPRIAGIPLRRHRHRHRHGHPRGIVARMSVSVSVSVSCNAAPTQTPTFSRGNRAYQTSGCIDVKGEFVSSRCLCRCRCRRRGIRAYHSYRTHRPEPDSTAQLDNDVQCAVIANREHRRDSSAVNPIKRWVLKSTLVCNAPGHERSVTSVFLFKTY